MVREERDLSAALTALGLADTENARGQMAVFADALAIHEERDARYGDGWRARGWLGNVADVLRKTERVRSMYWDRTDLNLDDDPDDAYDLMNYCAFAIRNAIAGNRSGRA